MGYKREQLLVGIPFYFRHVGKPLSTIGDNEVGLTSWKHVKEFNIDNEKGTFFYDKRMFFGDTPQRIRNKCQYVKDENLGGIMVWELSDDPEDALLGVINLNL